MALDEAPRRPRLAAEVGDPGRDVDVEVRQAVEQRPEPGEVLGVARQVGADEGRSRMGRDQRLERLHQPPVRGELRTGERPLGVGQQLLEPLVVAVDRIEEGGRVGRVDEHRQPELAGRREHGRGALVVGEQQAARGIAEAEPERLPDLQPARAGGGRTPQRLGQLVAEPVAGGRAGPVELAEGDEATRVSAVEAVEVRLELRVPAAVEVDRGLDRVAVAELEVGLGARPPSGRGGGRRDRSPSSPRSGPASARGGCGSRSRRSAVARPGCARAGACSPARTR